MTPGQPGATDLSAYTGAWALDTTRTTIGFRTKAMWVLPVKGTARAAEGGGQVEADGSVQGRLVIDASSIDTGVAKRDQHLRTADFFDAEAHPTIEFDLTGVRPLDDGSVSLDGTLLIHGQSQPVTVDSAVRADGDTVTVTGTIDDLDRRRWGLTWAKMGAGVHNKINVAAVFTRVQ